MLFGMFDLFAYLQGFFVTNEVCLEIRDGNNCVMNTVKMLVTFRNLCISPKCCKSRQNNNRNWHSCRDNNHHKMW